MDRSQVPKILASGQLGQCKAGSSVELSGTTSGIARLTLEGESQRKEFHGRRDKLQFVAEGLTRKRIVLSGRTKLYQEVFRRQ